MKLEDKKVLDLTYSLLGVLWFYIQKFLSFFNVKDIKRNRLTHISTKEDIAKGLNYSRKPNYFDVDLSSSGTTGKPTTVFASPMHWISEQSAQMQYFSENGYKFRDRMIIVRSYSPKKDEPIFKVDKIRNFIFISPFHINKENKQLILSFLKGRYFLRGYPSSLEILSKLLIEEDEFEKPVSIFTASETLTSFQRKIIENRFDRPVYDWYGTSEPSVLLFQTQKTYPRYKSPYNHCNVKIISEDDSNIIYGRSNWDSLSNLGFYKTNDIAVLDKEEHIIGIEGRKSDIIDFEDKSVPITNFLTLFYSIEGIDKFQIVNYLDIVKFNIHTNSKFNKNVLNELKIGITNRLTDIPFVIELNQQINRSEGGKTPYFIKLQKRNSISLP